LSSRNIDVLSVGQKIEITGENDRGVNCCGLYRKTYHHSKPAAKEEAR